MGEIRAEANQARIRAHSCPRRHALRREGTGSRSFIELLADRLRRSWLASTVKDIRSSCTPNFGSSDERGAWTMRGNFSNSDVGGWTLWLRLQDGKSTGLDDLMCSSGTIRPIGPNAGYAGFRRYDLDLAAVKSLFAFFHRMRYLTANPVAELALPCYENRFIQHQETHASIV